MVLDLNLKPSCVPSCGYRPLYPDEFRIVATTSYPTAIFSPERGIRNRFRAAGSSSRALPAAGCDTVGPLKLTGAAYEIFNSIVLAFNADIHRLRVSRSRGIFQPGYQPDLPRNWNDDVGWRYVGHNETTKPVR